MTRSTLRSIALIVSCSSLIVTAPVVAQESDTVTLRTVIVSATKTPVTRGELTQAVTVISGDDLRARGVARVSDALQLVPGAVLAQNGSFGSVNTLFLRGGESRYTKVLIDGVAVNASGGFFDFSHLTTDNVERIEIVRGPASVLYGADAVTGVIQIFTRQGSDALELNASVRAGTYGTADGDATVSGSSNGVAYSLGGGEHRTDGVLSFNNQYSNGTLSGSLSVKPRPESDARVSGRYTTAEFHYPTDFTGAPVDSNAYRVQHRLTLSLDAGTRVTSAIRARFVAGTNELSDLTEDIAVPFGATSPLHSAATSRGHRRSAEGRLLFSLPTSGTLTLGGEYLREKETSTNAEGPVGSPASPVSRFDAERTNRALYAELLGAAGNRISYTAAARADANSDFDSYATYRLGTSVLIAQGTRLRGSLSTAFNAPAFNQLRPTLFTVGSPGLAPERSMSWEAGIEHVIQAGLARVSASYFNQRFNDLIQYVAGGPPTYKGSYANLTEAQSNGYEAELEITPPGIVSASASFTHAVPRVARVSPAYSGDLVVGQPLLRRPANSGTASVTVTPRGGSLTAAASYVGERPDIDFTAFPSPTVTLPSYLKMDLSGSLDVWRRESSSLALTARIENAFDRRYETVLHFAAPGRVILVGARFGGSL